MLERLLSALLGVIHSAVDKVAGFCVVAFNLRRIKVFRCILEGEPQGSQLDLDLVDGLLTEVADIQQVRFGALSELTDGCLLYTSDAADDTR